jgi:hypothetical protein
MAPTYDSVPIQVLHHSFEQRNTHAASYFPAANGTHGPSGQRHHCLLRAPTRRRCNPFAHNTVNTSDCRLHLACTSYYSASLDHQAWQSSPPGARLSDSSCLDRLILGFLYWSFPFEKIQNKSADIAFPSAMLNTDLTSVSPYSYLEVRRHEIMANHNLAKPVRA